MIKNIRFVGNFIQNFLINLTTAVLSGTETSIHKIFTSQ